MKKISTLLVVAIGAAAAFGTLFAQADKKGKAGLPMVPAERLSPHETVYVRVGTDRPSSSLVSLTYGRPFSAKGGKGDARKIWGGLVPWGKADRLGADEVTTLTLEHPIEIGGKTISAGAHALYIVPNESGPSHLVFSSRIAKWGVPVDETKDEARVELKKESLAENVDQLTIILENHQTSGLIKIKWEKTQFSVPFTIKK